MALRQRRQGHGLEKVVEKLDAFNKYPEHYVEQASSSAVVYMVTWVALIVLVCSETSYFIHPPNPSFQFVPDNDFEAKLKINVDMTVAMPCDLIGADILDSTNQNTFAFGRLKEDPTWFDLDRVQRQHFESIRVLNEYLREEYHAIQNLLWKSGQSLLYAQLPERRTTPNEPHDACRIHGSLTLNKVSGNFHVAAGKTVPLMRGHAHLTGFFDEKDYNFTHRIDRFSFGEPHGGIIQPLEGDEKIAKNNMMNYQYFVQIVPTDIHTVAGLWGTYQYSVKELARPVDHEEGSHGVPGIYFRYDMSALKVVVRQDREPFWQWLVRLCAGAGGLVATSQIICDLLKWAISRTVATSD